MIIPGRILLSVLFAPIGVLASTEISTVEVATLLHQGHQEVVAETAEPQWQSAEAETVANGELQVLPAIRKYARHGALEFHSGANADYVVSINHHFIGGEEKTTQAERQFIAIVQERAGEFGFQVANSDFSAGQGKLHLQADRANAQDAARFLETVYAVVDESAESVLGNQPL